MSNFQDLCRDPNCRWSDALEGITSRLKQGIPQCLVRYGDGEYQSILGRTGPNADGQQHLPQTLGKELHGTLVNIAHHQLPNVLVGSDWRKPENALTYLTDNGFDESIQWCPVQPFVMGIESGLTMKFLKALKKYKGKVVLVGNFSLFPVVRGLGFNNLFLVSDCNAYNDMENAVPQIILCEPNVVIWCAGLGCKPALYKVFTGVKKVTCIDMGCFFDLAVGKQSRTWMTEPPDNRGWKYRREYIPYILGETK